MAATGWNPWTALRERTHITLMWQFLAGGRGRSEIWSDGAEIVVIDPRLLRRARKTVLAHELIHLERGLPAPDAPDFIHQVEEREVSRETVRRLIPLDQLALFVINRHEIEPITADTVAAEWDTERDIAAHALAMLRDAVAEPSRRLGEQRPA